MTIPQISIFASAHRPQYWMDLYNSIGNNDIAFELVLVGPNEPNFRLPENFRFIKSLVKPAQCLEIAARNAKADLILNMADDIEFRTERPLDNLYNTYVSYNNDKLILSCRLMMNEIDSHQYQLYNLNGQLVPPTLPYVGLMSRKLYMDIGGIDRNFIIRCWEVDIAMRIYALGGCIELSNVYANEAIDNLITETYPAEKVYLDNLWTTNGKVHFNRAKPVEPFSDDRILEESQGPKGKWV